MLRSARFQNLKGIRDLSIDLEPLTILVGPNGAGKTTVLEGIWLAGQVAQHTRGKHGATHVFMARWALDKILSATAKRLCLSVSVDTGALQIKISHGQKLQVIWQDAAGTTLDEEQFEKTLPRDADLRHLASAFKIRLDQEQIAQPSHASDKGPELLPDGSNLAAYLQYLHGLRDGSLEAIEQLVCAVIPRFRRVIFKPTSIDETPPGDGHPVTRPGVDLFLAFTDGSVVPATHVSEGTLLVLALLTIAHAPDASRLLLIDDLDRALHPAAQHRVIEALRVAMKATPDLQIIATSHSPDLVDACKPEEIRVMGFDAEGYPAVASLKDHPEAEKWLAQLRPGELWNSAGEDWVGEAARRRTIEREGNAGHG